jgi:hypothetical protein
MKRLIKVLLIVLFGRPRTPPWPWENPPGEDSPRRQAGRTCGGFGWTDLAVSGESLARGFLSSPIVSGENNCRTSRSCSSMMLLLVPSPGASRDAP